MKTLLISSIFVFILTCSIAIAQTYVEEEFIVEGAPVYTEPVPSQPVVVTPGTTVVTTTPPVIVVPAEQDVYVGMSRNHAVEILGPPTYVERFRRFTRRHHGIYDEVLTYATPTCNMVLYIKERRVQKIGYE